VSGEDPGTERVGEGVEGEVMYIVFCCKLHSKTNFNHN
jgi:hypothetical protein